MEVGILLLLLLLLLLLPLLLMEVGIIRKASVSAAVEVVEL